MSGDQLDRELPTPLVPEMLRSVLYVVGAFAGTIGAVLADGDTLTIGRLLVAVSVAANGLAIGYRPTRS